ncbi:MAG: hypothetical protein KDA96_04455 [Planctomycetaceae bacterium]|nr:hypothetical protein [Planctomycetaceae bacterium]
MANQAGIELQTSGTLFGQPVAGLYGDGLYPDGLTPGQPYCPPGMPLDGLSAVPVNPCQPAFTTQQLKYMSAFYGSDFVEELQELDSVLLNPQNKILSLNSMDTLSLPSALLVMMLAKNEHRQTIIAQFRQLIMEDLVQKEIEYYRALTRTRTRHPKINKLIRGRLQQHLDEGDAERIMENAVRTYNFSNSIGFFDMMVDGTDTLNDMQRSVVKMVQLAKATLQTEKELKAAALQLSLLEDRPGEIEEEFQHLSQNLPEDDPRLQNARRRLYAKRALLQLYDQKDGELVDLLEATRSQAAATDAFIKRIAIALEDDLASQFYEPAFQRIRRASTTWDVTLGQIETTTVLTNNRTMAKVSPAATFEFDLPHRDLLFTEALSGAKALTQEYGNLMNEASFLAAARGLGPQPAGGLVNPLSPQRQIPSLTGDGTQRLGAQLEALIPDPAIYKFETGTGFEITPVIQPDGQSIVYDFNYMYTTQVREPVRADEKHLGRIKRHYVHTDVQTGTYELREVSRYTIALKAARTDRGVPLFEDIPLLGAVFQPLPSDESALQQNIILASSTVYPSVIDLIGLKLNPSVEGLSSSQLLARHQKAKDTLHRLEQTMQYNAESVLDQHLMWATQPPIPASPVPLHEGPAPVIPSSYRPAAPPSRTSPPQSSAGRASLQNTGRATLPQQQNTLSGPMSSTGPQSSGGSTGRTAMATRIPTVPRSTPANASYRPPQYRRPLPGQVLPTSGRQ